MARIRSVKPEFWKSEAIARLSHRERLTFIALWSYVDDNGVGRDVPQLIAGELFALEPDPREALANVRGDLARLSEEGRITRYTVDGKPYLHITNWDEHQRIDKPNKARYPGPDDPGAALTCGYGDSRESPATPSRESRDSSEQVQRLEQGNRGAGEQRSKDNTTRSTALSLVDLQPVGFDEFWNVYPRKVGKQAAKKAWTKAIRLTSATTVIAGAIRYRDDPTRSPTYTQHPSSWLTDGRWDDESPVRPVEQQVSTTDAKVAQTLALAEHFRKLDGESA